MSDLLMSQLLWSVVLLAVVALLVATGRVKPEVLAESLRSIQQDDRKMDVLEKQMVNAGEREQALIRLAADMAKFMAARDLPVIDPILDAGADLLEDIADGPDEGDDDFVAASG